MIVLDRITFSYGRKIVLKDFSLSVADGELLALMGPSGCGKSTLLNLIAGLRRPDEGTVRTDEPNPVYVFQEPRLFPWMTVEENLRAVLPKSPEPERIRRALAFVGLEDEAKSLPSDLSGGMKSRVSLARALLYGEAQESRLYLLDEPFSALDEASRVALRDALRTKFQKEGATAVLVTHDSAEASAFADRTVVLHDAEQEQTVPPAR